MRRRRLIWKLYPAYLLAILLSIAAAGWYATEAIRAFLTAQTRQELRARAGLLSHQFGPDVLRMPASDLESLCRDLGERGATRVTLIAPDGRVLADSEHEPSSMENHLDRLEVARALAGEEGSSIRFSQTLGTDMMYLTRPVRDGPRVAAVLRVALPLSRVHAALRGAYARLLVSGLILAAAAAGLGLLVFSRVVGRPLREIRGSAMRIAGGDLDHRVPAPDSEELAGVAGALNAMADQLGQKLRLITRQGQEQRAMLAGMAEGVLAFDHHGRILSLNPAAGKLLSAEPSRAFGRPLIEVIRNSQLQQFVEQTLSGAGSHECTLVLHDEDGRDQHLQARGTPLRDAAGQAIGALVVLNDVTRLHRLELVRRDFVANVSHELKTPVTAIAAAVETLRDGGPHEPDTAARFLDIVARQSARLQRIIEDLLRLSRLEQEGSQAQVERSTQGLCGVLRAALEDCRALADERGVGLVLDCPDGLVAPINAPLIEQAVVNLLDNAIKYSSTGQAVGVRAAAHEREVRIEVEDRGCGIAAEHLPRLFERFYRVDKARSRQLGGTGLGLAIVKHIAQAHGGSVTVQSAVGRGSVFTIRLPRPA